MKFFLFVQIFALIFLNSLLFSTVYENAEDGNKNGWRVYDKTPAGATISNVEDNGDRVIELQGDGTKNGYILGDWIGGTNVWNNRTEKTIRWRMKYDEDFVVYVNVETEKGERYLYYTNSNNNDGQWRNYIHHGLGLSASNGTWQTFSRDLESDLKDLESDNSIVAVNAFLIRGSGMVDDINLLPKRSYEDSEDKNTEGWSVYDVTPAGATITSVFDVDRGDRVIQLSGASITDIHTDESNGNGYMLGDWSGGANVWNNSTEKNIRWSMKYNEKFVVYVSVETTEGHRYLYYTDRKAEGGWISAKTDGGKGKVTRYVHHGLGTDASDGQWRTFTRDLEGDLRDLEPDNSIITVNAFHIRGPGLVDDIELLDFGHYYRKIQDLELRKLSLSLIRGNNFYEGEVIVDKGRGQYIYETKSLQPGETIESFCESRGLLSGLTLDSRDEHEIFGFWFYGINGSRDAYNLDFFDCSYKSMVYKNSEPVDTYIAFGNSITAGKGDRIFDDGKGYEPILADLLGVEIINKGEEDKESVWGLEHIDEILNENSDVTKYLIMFGTNDSGPWHGEDENVPVSKDAFKANMRGIIEKILDKNRVPIIAKIPRVLGGSSKPTSFYDGDMYIRNTAIIEYNEVIQDLTDEYSLTSGPDFYKKFKDTYPGGTLQSTIPPPGYDDPIHPNGEGYKSMAKWWFDVLSKIR